MSSQRSPRYIAMIGDLVGSRSTPAAERREIQARLTDRFGTMAAGEPAGAAARPLVGYGCGVGVSRRLCSWGISWILRRSLVASSSYRCG